MTDAGMSTNTISDEHIVDIVFRRDRARIALAPTKT